MKKIAWFLGGAAAVTLLSATPVLSQEGGANGYKPVTIPTANGGELTVEPATVNGTTIMCRIHGYDGNPQTGMLIFNVPFILNVQIPPFPMDFEDLPEAERIQAEQKWTNDRIAPLTRPELWPCMRSALELKFRQEYRQGAAQ